MRDRVYYIYANKLVYYEQKMNKKAVKYSECQNCLIIDWQTDRPTRIKCRESKTILL